MRLTNADLAEIKKRAEAATEGPWELDDKAVTITVDGIMYDITSKVFSEADATFIAHARQDVPALLAEVERLRNENSLLCPIGDLDVITSLRTEKALYMERIAELEAEVRQLRFALESIVNIDGRYIDTEFDVEDAYKIIDEIAREALINGEKI